MKHLSHPFRNRSYLIPALLGLAAAILLLVNCLRVWPFTADDAFITFRYSKNLAQGIGPTFNAVGPRAEGYTSFLWMLVMALPHALGFGVVTFGKLAGVLAMLGTMVWMAVFIDRAASAQASLPGRRFALAAAGLAALCFALLPETAVHAVSGMETAGYLFLLTGLVTCTYLAITGSRRAADWLPLVALLAGLMRPEANLVAALMLAAVFTACPQGRRPFLVRAALLYIIPGILYFLWRWNYFGVLLPLPFYAKTGGSGLPGLLTIVSPFLMFLLANFGVFIGMGLFDERKAVGILLLAILPDLAFWTVSYPVMNYDYRFAYPLLPLALILAGMGLATLMQQAEAWSAGRRWQSIPPAWVALFSLLMVIGQNAPRTAYEINDKLGYAQAMANAHYAIGHALSQVAHGGGSPVLVVTDAGAMPYFSDWNTIDAGGLNDTAIALRRVEPVDYIFSHNPEVLVLTSTNTDEYRNDDPYSRDLYQRALDSGLVAVARTVFYKAEGSAIWVLARPNGAAAKKLSALLGDK